MSFLNVTLQLLNGFVQNAIVFGVTLLFAIPLGLLIAKGSMSKIAPIKAITRTFVWIIRGTPLMLQIFVVFYVPPLMARMFGVPFFGFDRAFKAMLAACIAFVINYAAYFSEIYRSGIESIPRGQYEAGAVFGMTKSQIFFKVVLMQVIKRILPPMSNEIITLVKDTSLARVISIPEILKIAENYSLEGLIWPLFYTGAFFLLFSGGLTLLFNFIEKKLSYYKI